MVWKGELLLDREQPLRRCNDCTGHYRTSTFRGIGGSSGDQESSTNHQWHSRFSTFCCGLPKAVEEKISMWSAETRKNEKWKESGTKGEEVKELDGGWGRGCGCVCGKFKSCVSGGWDAEQNCFWQFNTRVLCASPRNKNINKHHQIGRSSEKIS